MGPLEEVVTRERSEQANKVLATDITTHKAPVGQTSFICDTTAGATALILPHPREVTGKFISIFLIVDGGNLTPKYYKGETLTSIGDALTAVSDHVLLHSNGNTYDVLVDITT